MIRRGVNPEQAIALAGSAPTPAEAARSGLLIRALPDRYFESLGLTGAGGVPLASRIGTPGYPFAKVHPMPQGNAVAPAPVRAAAPSAAPPDPVLMAIRLAGWHWELKIPRRWMPRRLAGKEATAPRPAATPH